MKNVIIGLICMISQFISFGHNSLSARYHLETGEQASLLTINLSQDGVNHVLSKKYGNDRLNEIDRKEFEELIVDYIKSNFNLSVDKKNIELKEGGIKLGSHQTDLKFVLPPFSKKVARIDLDIPAFKENANHQTIFSYSINGRTDHVILGSDNNYRSTIILSTSTPSYIWWFFFIGLTGLIGF